MEMISEVRGECCDKVSVDNTMRFCDWQYEAASGSKQAVSNEQRILDFCIEPRSLSEISKDR